MRKLERKGFSFVEALVAIGAMVIVAAAILSAFLSSSHLRVFSENFTIGINACQKELERICYHYEEKDRSATHLSFSQLLSNYQSGVNFSVLDKSGNPDPNFKGVVVSVDPYAGQANKEGRLVKLTARMAFRVGSGVGARIVGGDSSLNPQADTPCQTSMTIANED